MVELAAYAVRDVAVHAAIHSSVHDALRTVEGYRGGTLARQLEDPTAFADLLGWESVDAHKRAGEALQARVEFGTFFAGIGDMKVFELFSVLG